MTRPRDNKLRANQRTILVCIARNSIAVDLVYYVFEAILIKTTIDVLCNMGWFKRLSLLWMFLLISLLPIGLLRVLMVDNLVVDLQLDPKILRLWGLFLSLLFDSDLLWLHLTKLSLDLLSCIYIDCLLSRMVGRCVTLYLHRLLSHISNNCLGLSLFELLLARVRPTWLLKLLLLSF